MKVRLGAMKRTKSIEEWKASAERLLRTAEGFKKNWCVNGKWESDAVERSYRSIQEYCALVLEYTQDPDHFESARLEAARDAMLYHGELGAAQTNCECEVPPENLLDAKSHEAHCPVHGLKFMSGDIAGPMPGSSGPIQ